MVFWIGILIGGLFAWLAVKMGFYETWVLLFNLVIAVYLAVFLGPVLANIVPICRDTMYNNLLCIIAAGVGGFLVLHGIAYYLFTSQYKVPFPKAIDSLVAGCFGFLIGFLVWTFVSLLICISPIAQNTFVSEFDFVDGFKQKGAPYVGWWCNRVNSIVASKDSDVTSEQIISSLLKNTGLNTPAEPNQPATPDDLRPPPPPEF